MKLIAVFVLSLAAAGIPGVAVAQSGTGRNYNPATEATITGTVDSVTHVPSQGPGGTGLHLVLAASSGTIDVHVGPASFVASKNMTLAKGDTLTVVGSKVTLSGQAVLIAREIRKADQLLTLRDANGLPLWSGGRKR
jgi:hypothetical protein